MSNAKDRILDASSELFRRQGLTGTGIKQILDHASAPFSSLYHHFPGGKDELAAETIKRAGGYYGQLVTQKLLAEADFVAGVRKAFVAAGEDLAATGYADACPIETVALEVASTNEPLRRATAAVFDSWLDGLTAMLRSEGIEATRARALAHTILSALEGAFVLARAARRTDALDACSDAMAQLVESAIAQSQPRSSNAVAGEAQPQQS
jgi:AcrR family transcriptional regulator